MTLLFNPHEERVNVTVWVAWGMSNFPMMPSPKAMPVRMELEHPMGKLEVLMDVAVQGDNLEVYSVGLTRTARKLAAGEVYIPNSVWERDI